MKKTKIAFCVRDMQVGGVESMLIRTVENLIQDNDITIVSFVDMTEPHWAGWFMAHPNVKRIILYPSKYFGTKMPRFFLWRIMKHLVRDVYRFWRRVCVARKLLSCFDVVVDYHDFGFVRELKNIKNVKKIAWFHSSLSVFQKRKFSRNLCVYDNVVLLTDDCANELKTLCPQYADKFVRIYNPIDIKNIRDKSLEKCPVRGKYFCSVTRMSYDKDIKTLLNAFDIFWQKHKRVKLVLVGGGDKIDVFGRYAESLKSGKNIIFMGNQKNPYPFMAHAMANVLSSYGEGLPTVLMESQAVGTVNISANCKYGPREILLDGRAGLLFAPGDVGALAKHMANVYENNVDVKKMVQLSARELKRFEQRTIIKQIKSLIS